MRKYIDKDYIYNRDGGTCVLCGRQLRRNHFSVDHYYPKSAGGTYDVFNLVSACKKCNQRKKSMIPDDYEAVTIKLFKEAVKDKKVMLMNNKTYCYSKLLELIEHVYGVTIENGVVIFNSVDRLFYVKQNKIVQVRPL